MAQNSPTLSFSGLLFDEYSRWDALSLILCLSLSVYAQDTEHIYKLTDGNNLESRLRTEDGQSNFKSYRRQHIRIEDGDSIYYLELYRADKFWKLYRYRIQNQKLIIEGSQQLFDPDGQLQTELYCPSGEKKCSNWQSFSWWPNGQLAKNGFFKEGQMDSVHYTYYSEGQLRSRLLYKEGKLMEVLELNDEQGNPLEKGTINKGEGTVFVYSLSGEKIAIYEYRNGKRKSKKRIKKVAEPEFPD